MKEEDIIYYLLGLYEVSIPPLYSEGKGGSNETALVYYKRILY